jgi:hypothetical protein
MHAVYLLYCSVYEDENRSGDRIGRFSARILYPCQVLKICAIRNVRYLLQVKGDNDIPDSTHAGQEMRT